MREKFEEIIYKVKNKYVELNEKLSKRTKILIVGVAVAVIAVAFVIALFLNSASWGVLYTGLDESEVIEIVKVLEE